MPPEVSHYSHHPLVTSKTPLLLSRFSPKSHFKQILHQKYYQKRMKFTKKQLISLLVFILSSASIFRFLNIIMITTPSPPLTPTALPTIHKHDYSSPSNASSPTDKEMRFLMGFFSHKVPCNLLVFGLEYQYSSLASLNAGGVTIFLEDNLRYTSTFKSSNNTRVYKIMYNTVASEAYKLLKDARENPDCSPKLYLPKVSKCNLGLSNLPQEVYDTMWDVVVVDGPRGNTLDSPGRMAAIYTAGVLARRGNTSHVLVHDVDRMIEKWFSWEFLCEENLVSSKGRFWDFQMHGLSNATTFCTK
ncbi:hypothetical protein BUALT_Bualt07G0088300 [Buddleja alternifolia]|uniref:Polysaccharide biosynthesis domain-containing protein n=1 Tax=Buddleja alternifolia TaxID=168488 RepID=A0AAV6XFU7_9LAMI|nr:hypothetical protein BUALT_Bualt07G0088300 [Buddleja alternifolia]